MDTFVTCFDLDAKSLPSQSIGWPNCDSIHTSWLARTIMELLAFYLQMVTDEEV